MFVLGIDGGGTHTRLELRDMNNRLLRREEFGPFNLNSIGEDGFRQLLRQVFEDCGGMQECARLCVGGAGELCDMALAVQKKLHLEGCPIALLGGLFSGDNPYRRCAVEKLSALGTVIAPAHDALWGAAQMAWEL